MLTYNVLNEYVERLKKQDMPVVATTDNVAALTTDDINKLRAGDIVLKEDESGKHAYVVSYKKDGTGICMTYTDATYAETISYDYNSVTKEWVYNSMDSIEFVSKAYVDSLMSGALKREIVETLPVEDIDTNTIYMVLDSEASTQGNVYNEYMYINNSWELIGATATTDVTKYRHNIVITSTTYKYEVSVFIENEDNTSFTIDSFKNYIIANFNDTTKFLNASGYLKDSSYNISVSRIGYTGFQNTPLRFYGLNVSSGNPTSTAVNFDSYDVTLIDTIL